MMTDVSIRPRSAAPLWAKRYIWNLKHRHVRTNAVRSPQDIVSLISDELDASSCLLDLGCGPGHLLAALRTAEWRGSYIGVDISERAVQTARLMHDPKAEFIVSSIEHFPLPTRKVNSVTFVESLYYVRQDLVAGVLARCRAALLPGGRIHARIWSLPAHCAYVDRLIHFNGGNCRCSHGTIWSI